MNKGCVIDIPIRGLNKVIFSPIHLSLREMVKTGENEGNNKEFHIFPNIPYKQVPSLYLRWGNWGKGEFYWNNMP